MTIFIVSFIIITIIVLCTVSCIIEDTNENKQKKEYDESLNSVVPVTLLFRRNNIPLNPFVDFQSNDSSIKVLEVKKDTSGKIWIKYAYQDLFDNNKYMEEYACCDKLEIKLDEYPNIVLPK